MRPTQHPKNNDVLGAPPGVTHDQCTALAITRCVDHDGLPSVISYWQPTPEELKRLNQGKAVAVQVWGRTHAPLYIGVDGGAELP